MFVPSCASAHPFRRTGVWRPSPGGYPAFHIGIRIVLETEHRPVAAEVVLAASTRRTWVSPAVVEMGGMRQLTLLQGASIAGNCDLTGNDPSCGF